MEYVSDPVLLSRLQLALTAMFHIIWPVLTIGLSLFLVALEALWLKTREAGYYHHARFWSRLLLLNFALGVVSGLPLEFAFGTNRAPFVWGRVIFLAVFVGLAASLYPYRIPARLTLDDAAASSPALVFMLVGIGMLIPVMLVYNGYRYRVFRGSAPRGPRVAVRRAESPVEAAQPPFNYRSHADSSRWAQG
jgi:cytochrome bd-type quinol oxidase subunit 2